jgi:histidyl-tRNA synthetase
MALLESMGVARAKLNLSTMRGLGYYDGIVYEAQSKTYPEIGSIGGGGRYGNLVGRFSKTTIIGSGCAIGTNRMLITALESGRVDLSAYESNVDVAVLCMGQNNVAYAMSVLAALRDAKIVAVPYLDTGKKVKNQIEFADKIKSRFSVIIGEDEVKNKLVALKNMTTGEQVNLSLADAIKTIQ